jgi:hypothetical protein
LIAAQEQRNTGFQYYRTNRSYYFVDESFGNEELNEMRTTNQPNPISRARPEFANPFHNILSGKSNVFIPLSGHFPGNDKLGFFPPVREIPEGEELIAGHSSHDNDIDSLRNSV